MRLTLFGSPALDSGSTGSALPFERRHQLVVLLALKRGWVTRAEIAALLWPDQESKLAYANLRKTLFRLQQLPWAAAIESQGSALRFEPDTDVAAFEAALAAGRPDEALALARGELLAGFDDGQSEPWTQWLRFERERLRGAWRNAALERAATLDASAAVALSARLLEADPLDEAALGAHLDALARDGQAGAARQAYRRFAERLADELGIEPGAQLRALHEALSAPARIAAPAPSRDDGFIGRTIELQRIADLLARAECRLLILLGPGGAGKTRLATRALHALHERFADGALWVELEDARTPAHFAQRLADALQVRAGSDAQRAVTAALADRETLLVLDNFEPLAEHAAALIEPLLAAAPRVKLLVTSRVRLAVASEWSMPIEGLPWPEPEDEDRAEAFDAVRLFVRAAQRMEPGWAPAAEQAAIVDICRQVEGLPLAIELAAAWVRVLPCAAIADELRQGSELLRAQDASHPARHASIEQVFEQSWKRLAAAERTVLARLSVFRGGFSAEAARAVAAAALPVLGALADKSLLRKDGARLHLHPLVQQLASAKLGDDGAAALAHARWFLRRLVQLKAAIKNGRREALGEIDTEFENCRQAWQVAIAAGDAAALNASAKSLLNYCDYRGRFEEGLTLMREAADSTQGGGDEALRTLCIAQTAHLAYRLGRYPQARAAAAQALEIAQLPRDLEAKVQALTVLASCALQTDRLEEARRLYRETLALVRSEHGPDQGAGALDNLALVEKRLGHYDEALRLSLESLGHYRVVGDNAGVALCLNNLGTLYKQMHDWDSAIVQWREGLALSEREGLVEIRSYLLTNVADAHLQVGDLDAAWRDTETGLELAQATGNVGVRCYLGMTRARIALRRGDFGAARDELARALHIAVTRGVASLQAAALLVFAELIEAQGHRAAARRVLAFAADHPKFNAADRDELRTEWARRADPTTPDAAWPAIGLDELLHRIGVERESAHAGLIAALA